jgi:hypothetical protein
MDVQLCILLTLALDEFEGLAMFAYYINYTLSP